MSVKKPGFGSYLLAIVLPPMSLFAQGKFIAGIFASAIAFVSFLLLFLPFIPIMAWFVLAGWAIFSLKNREQQAFIEQQADSIANAMAKRQV